MATKNKEIKNVIGNQDQTQSALISLAIEFNLGLVNNKKDKLNSIAKLSLVHLQLFEINNLEKEKVKLKLEFESKDESFKIINKMLLLFYDRNSQQITPDISSFSLSINFQKMHIQVLQRISNDLQKFFPHITEFKFECKNEINNKQLENITKMIEKLRSVLKFEFTCLDKIAFKAENASQFIEAITKATRNCTSFSFNNPIIKKKTQSGYSNQEISKIPGMLSKIVSSIKTLEKVELNFYFIGWHKTCRNKAITSECISELQKYLTAWPTSLQKLEINLNRLVCFNTNISSIMVQNFISQLVILVSNQTNLKELSLDLTGIGYSGGSSQNKRYYQLAQLTQHLKTVKKLSLEVNLKLCLFYIKQLKNIQKIGGHIFLSEDEWMRLFEGISNIQELTHLNLNVEFWKLYNGNLNSIQQYRIIDQFIDNLVKNHKNYLQTLSLNTDEWYFLPQVNQFELLKKISEFEYLNSLQLLFYKSEDLEEFSLLKCAEEYYRKVFQMQKKLSKSHQELPQIINSLKNYQELATQSIVEQQINNINNIKFLSNNIKEEIVKNTTKIIQVSIKNMIKSFQEFESDSIQKLNSTSLIEDFIQETFNPGNGQIQKYLSIHRNIIYIGNQEVQQSQIQFSQDRNINQDDEDDDDCDNQQISDGQLYDDAQEQFINSFNYFDDDDVQQSDSNHSYNKDYIQERNFFQEF